jgi:hypothetical protein
VIARQGSFFVGGESEAFTVTGLTNPIGGDITVNQMYVQYQKDAGGDAEMMYLPDLGIKGNSHLLMQDRNNLDVADLLLDWIDKRVGSGQAQAR